MGIDETMFGGGIAVLGKSRLKSELCGEKKGK
jgi:hypothetical protein